jgi:hypothetical protein
VFKCLKTDTLANSTYVDNIATIAANGPIACDNTYLYVATSVKIYKVLCFDMSIVSSIGSYGTGPDQFSAIYDISTDGVYLYVCDNVGTNQGRYIKRLALDLSYVADSGPTGGFGMPASSSPNSPILYCANAFVYV